MLPRQHALLDPKRHALTLAVNKEQTIEWSGPVTEELYRENEAGKLVRLLVKERHREDSSSRI